MATSKLVKTNEKIAEALTEVFFNIEHGVVDRYIKIEDTFVKPIFLQKKAKQQPKPKNGCCRNGHSGNRHSGKADEQCI